PGNPSLKPHRRPPPGNHPRTGPNTEDVPERAPIDDGPATRDLAHPAWTGNGLGFITRLALALRRSGRLVEGGLPSPDAERSPRRERGSRRSGFQPDIPQPSG